MSSAPQWNRDALSKRCVGCGSLFVPLNVYYTYCDRCHHWNEVVQHSVAAGKAVKQLDIQRKKAAR